MKKVILIVLTFVVILLTACQSVYVLPEITETTASPDITADNEYFTTGNVNSYLQLTREDGYYYQGVWYYPEIRKYKISSSSEIDGSIKNSSVSVNRIVRYNAQTGIVSSACLDPSCSHSPGSDCLLLHIESSSSKMWIERIVGDWMLVTKIERDDIIGNMYQMISYNLKTGESRVVFSDSMHEQTMTIWIGGSPFGNKLYMVKNILDYSQTKFDGNTPLRYFEPQTISIACEYNLDTNECMELFKLPSGYIIKAFSNKRLLVTSDTGEYYTCYFDGTNMIRTDVLDFSSHTAIGTYAYYYLDDGFKFYDIKTNTQNNVTINDFTLYGNCIITDGGIIYNTFTTIDEWKEMIAGAEAYVKENGANSAYKYQSMCDSVKYKGTAQLWRSDHKGDNLELIFEKENAVIRYLFGNEKFIYGYVTYGDPTSHTELPYENNGRTAINLETGEMVSIPYLDIAPVDGYELVWEE